MKHNRTTLSRRDFIIKLQAAGLAIPAAGNLDNLIRPKEERSFVFRNDYFSVSVGSKYGKIDIYRSDGSPLLTGSVIRAVSENVVFSSGGSTFRHTIRTGKVSDIFGEGMRLMIRYSGSEQKIAFNKIITLYDNLHSVFLEAECINLSTNPIILKEINPVYGENETDGNLHWNRTSKMITNGPMYYDPGKVYDFSDVINSAKQSWWNIGLFSGYDSEGLAVGAIENLTAQGKISVQNIDGDSIRLAAHSILADGFVLGPGKSVRSNRFVLNIGRNPYEALEGYADYIGKLNKARVSSLINGWCNWFYTYEHISEGEIIRNAEFAARILKPYGLEYIQVDEGYQKWHGEWEGNERFPHGMKWLSERIHSLGLKPGIWIAPYVISEPADVFKNHKDWLIKHPDGSLKRVGPWPGEDTDWARNENPKRYGLDITHPGAAEWIYSLFDKISKQWGYEMIKIDFVDWSLLSAHHYYDRSVSRAMAYRKGFEIFRKASGDGCHLQDCGPGPVTVGLLDSMRIELDQNYGYRNEVWNQYFNSTGSAPAAAKRYYFHKRTWINDADHLCLNLLSISQAQAAATLIALTGGNLISGDRLTDLDAVRLDILQKTLPSFGEAAKPVDLFNTDSHRIFALKIKKPYGDWIVVAFFNSNESKTEDYDIPLERLWMNNTTTYIGFDFWNCSYFGEVNKKLKVTILPNSCQLLSLHEKRGTPQFISCDRHLMQGAVEIDDIRWDKEKQVLSGASTGIQGSSYNIYFYVPDPHPWKQGGTALYHDFQDYTLKMTDNNILRMHLRFNHGNRIEWRVNFPEFFNKP